MTLISSFLIRKNFINSQESSKEVKKPINGLYSIFNLLNNKKIITAILPLMFTIIFTSTLSVLVIVYVIDIVRLNSTQYGIYSATISLSLAVLPFLLIKIMAKLGEATAACLSATGIGLSLLMLSMTNNYWLLLLFGAVMGGFNGTQNTIMSAFMLKNISVENRENYMPAYILILQLCVFIGFLISMFVSSENIIFICYLFSFLTALFGICGAWVNYKIKN